MFFNLHILSVSHFELHKCEPQKVVSLLMKDDDTSLEQYILNVGLQVNALVTEGGEKLPSVSCEVGASKCLQALITNGLDPNFQTGPKRKISLFHKSAEAGHLECIEVLLGANGDCTKPDYRGWLPLHAASQNG